ncbi:MAG TPA: hypothetical protein VG013_30060, partial [Gemmataceae bacterium]|nr:hypothetical protein [Gemmataceae bacterium]
MKARFLFVCSLLALAVVVARGQADKESPKSRQWTLDEAMGQLRLNPRDSYLQYVALQLARREGRVEQTATEIERLTASAPWQARRGGVDLFSIFTGALAVQESLQLDAMTGRQRREPALKREEKPGRPENEDERPAKAAEGKHDAVEKPNKETVRVADLSGPTVKSHPWDKMLAGKKPAISPLARSVPDDYYFIEFHSLSKLLEAMEISDLWGTHLFDQAVHEARSQKAGDRLKKQLVVETSAVLRPFYDLVVREVAVTGSDLFAREGSDVTLLFRFKQPDVFKSRMDGFLANAEKALPGVRRTTGKYLDVAYVHLETPDRDVNVYSAYAEPDLHVRSNSEAAFRRVLEAIHGKTAAGKAVRRLGDTSEFAYIRTLLPRGAKQEDGFVYLSDPFIRHMVGARLKLTERRRMVCYNNLRMIGHASLLYRTEHGCKPDLIEALAKEKCSPGRFNEGELRCPDGGTYTLSKDGNAGVCSHHGHAHFLTPCCEIPVSKVTD